MTNTLSCTLHTRAVRDPQVFFYQKSMFYLCLPFVFECGYRSILPCVDIPRLCLFNVWGNNVLFGRASAFIGEWCWMLQISLALRNILDGLDSRKALWLNKLCTGLSVSLPALCLLAECLGTAGPVTTNNLWCIWEAVTWTTMFTIATGCAVYIKLELNKLPANLFELNRDANTFSVYLIVTGVLYVPYMLAINIPMYVRRWKVRRGTRSNWTDPMRLTLCLFCRQEDEADASVTYLPFNEGLPDIAICHDDDDAWEKWGADFAWMVLYFGPAVWTSIWLCKAPRIVERSDSMPLVKVGM